MFKSLFGISAIIFYQASVFAGVNGAFILKNDAQEVRQLTHAEARSACQQVNARLPYAQELFLISGHATELLQDYQRTGEVSRYSTFEIVALGSVVWPPEQNVQSYDRQSEYRYYLPVVSPVPLIEGLSANKYWSDDCFTDSDYTKPEGKRTRYYCYHLDPVPQANKPLVRELFLGSKIPELNAAICIPNSSTPSRAPASLRKNTSLK